MEHIADFIDCLGPFLSDALSIQTAQDRGELVFKLRPKQGDRLFDLRKPFPANIGKKDIVAPFEGNLQFPILDLGKELPGLEGRLIDFTGCLPGLQSTLANELAPCHNIITAIRIGLRRTSELLPTCDLTAIGAEEPGKFHNGLCSRYGIVAPSGPGDDPGMFGGGKRFSRSRLFENIAQVSIENFRVGVWGSRCRIHARHGVSMSRNLRATFTEEIATRRSPWKWDI